jgi:hypothetical protein
MTEAEWLSGEASFVELLRDGSCAISERKLRLFVCACVRRVWTLLADPRCQRAVAAAECYADGLLSDAVLDAAWKAAWEVCYLTRGLGAVRAAAEAAGAAARRPLTPQKVLTAVEFVRGAVFEEAQRLLLQRLGDGDPFAAETEARRAQQHLFRDIVGNPFRPPTLEPAWLAYNGGVVPQLARAIHQERRFTDLPVLGDALEDAGCDLADVLEHCHGPGAHAPGCWVVDLVLGRA